MVNLFMKFRNQQRIQKCRGFSLIELLIAMAVTIIIAAAALMLFKNSLDTNNIAMLRAEMQANARAAANSISQDLNLTGIGMPWGGLGLPSNGAAAETFATNYLTKNTFYNNTLFGITPSYQGGPVISNTTMDGITMVYQDPVLSDTTQLGWNWTVNPVNSMVSGGANTVVMTLPTAANAVAPQVPMNPAVNNPSYGLQIGDVLLIKGNQKLAAGVITGLDAANGIVTFGSPDAFNINQFGLGFNGNIPSLGDPGTNPRTYTNANTFNVMRIYIITYFLQPVDANGNVLPAASLNNAPDYRLMRQVNAQPATVVAEHIDYLRFSYDLTDPSCLVAPYIGAEPDAINSGAACNNNVAFNAFSQIRSVNISLAARTAKPDKNGQYYHDTVNTTVSPRMLSYNNTYPPS